jgi:hypothetical protein
MKTETYKVLRGTPCIREMTVIGKRSRELGELYRDVDYDVTNLKLIEGHINDGLWDNIYSFELWDDEGHIGDYYVRKLDWEENTVSKGIWDSEYKCLKGTK